MLRYAASTGLGDDKLVRTEQGELVDFATNRWLKTAKAIFSHLKDMGIEDPERYVV